MPRPDPLLTQLQREIADLRAQVKTLQSAPRLRHASIDDASVPIKGPDGRVKAVLGKQADGSHGDKVIESGPQPTPTPPILDPGAGALSVEWDGGVDDGDVPQIFGRVEVLAAPIPEGTEPDPDDARHLSSVYSAESGATTIKATSGDWAVWLRMVGADGKTYSELSEPTTVTLDPTVDELTLRERIEAALTGELDDGLYDSLAGRIAQFIELEAESIKAYHLSIDALDGQKITGSTFQTHHADNRGIKWTDEGVVAYSDEGRVTIWLDGQQNRIAGTFRMEGLGQSGDVVIRDFREEELFDPDLVRNPESIYAGIGFIDTHGDSLPAGIFIAPDKGLRFVTGGPSSGRPRADMGGNWRVQNLIVSDVFAPNQESLIGLSPLPLNLLNGWRTGEQWGDERPRFVRFGNMIFLRGSIRTPSSGHMGSWISGLPIPSYRRRMSTARDLNAGGSAAVITLEVDTRGYFSVVGGSSITQDRLIHLDGLFYYL